MKQQPLLADRCSREKQISSIVSARQSSVVLFVRGFFFKFEQQRQENLVEGGEGREGLKNDAQEDIHSPGGTPRNSWWECAIRFFKS